jgi:hypothetical protein
MGKHVNADAGTDEPDATEAALVAEAHEPEHARHVAEPDHPLEAQAVISPDTHVGVDLDEVAPGTADAAPSPADPDALVEHGLVGDGHEME